MFDPYHKWLGILPKDQPPNHYRLLSIELFESDLDVIESAADRQMGFLRQFQSGEHAAAAAKLLNEIATARLCLLKPKSKAEYDEKLRRETTVASLAEIAPEPEPEPVEILRPAPRVKKKPAPSPEPRPKRKKRKMSETVSNVLVAIGAGLAILAIALSTLPFPVKLFSSNPRQPAIQAPVGR